MKKKMLCLLFATFMVVSAVGCGSNKTESKDTTQQTESTQESESKTEETTQITESTTEQETSKETTSGEQISSSEGAVAVLEAIWDMTGEKFPCYGGSIEQSVDNAPGSLKLTDKDTMTNTLLIPAEMQDHISDAATLMHMMNANTFTGVAMMVEGTDVKDVADQMKESFLGNQFMCGIPDKIAILSVGDYVVYAYGEAGIIDEFSQNAQTLEGAALLVDQNYGE